MTVAAAPRDEHGTSPRDGDELTSAGQPSARVSAWIAIAVVVAAVAIAPLDGDGLLDGSVGTVQSGAVERFGPDGWEPAAAGTRLDAGDELRIGEEPAMIGVPAGRLRLAPGTELALDRGRLELETGSVLAETEELFGITLGVTRSRGAGTWRVDAATTDRAAVYEGGAGVTDETGAEVSLGRLEQVAIEDGAIAGSVRPLRYVAGDPWDDRLLAGAIAVDRLVAQVARSLAGAYGAAPQPPGFYRDFTADEEVVAAVVPADAGLVGPPAEVLVEIAVVQALVTRAGLAPGAAAGTVDRLRAAGGAWGLILLRHDLGADHLEEAVDDALRERRERAAAGTATPPRPEPATPAPETPPAGPAEEPDGTAGDTSDPGEDDGTDPDGDEEGEEEPNDPEEEDPGPLPLDPVEEVGDVIDDLIGDPPGLPGGDEPGTPTDDGPVGGDGQANGAPPAGQIGGGAAAGPGEATGGEPPGSTASKPGGPSSKKPGGSSKKPGGSSGTGG